MTPPVLNRHELVTRTFKIATPTVHRGDSFAAGSPSQIAGYAAVWDKPSENLGGFVEKIRAGAFTETLKDNRSDPRLLWDHNSQYVLGRRSCGTLKLEEDAKGLWFEAIMPETSYACDLQKLIERGDVNQMSFGFFVLRDEWRDLDKPVAKRDVLEVRLHEISIVSFPAYPQTSVGVRGADARAAWLRACMDADIVLAGLAREVGI